MKVISDNGDIKKFIDWVDANSSDIPPEIVYPKKEDGHGHGHGHDDVPSVAEPLSINVKRPKEEGEHFIEELKASSIREPKELSTPEVWYRFLAFVGGLLVAIMLLVTVALLPKFGSPDAPALNEVATRYLESGLKETGAVNAVTGMILDYRAFDTLGESVVLFTATVTVIFLLQQKERNHEENDKEAIDGNFKGIRSLPAKVIVRITFPFIMLYGIYIVLNGHLSPGGGFSGGAILGGGLVLNHIVFGQYFSERFINVKKCTKLMAGGLFVYIILKTFHVITGANGINIHIPLGTPGSIFSSGLIFPLNICVGLIVACTVFSLYSLFADWSQ